MNAAGGVLRGVDGSVRYGSNAAAVGEYARAAVRVGGDGGVANFQRAAGHQRRRADSIEAGGIAAGGIRGVTGQGAVRYLHVARRDQQRVFIRCHRVQRYAGKLRVFRYGLHGGVGVGLAAAAGAAHAARATANVTGRGFAGGFSVRLFRRGSALSLRRLSVRRVAGVSFRQSEGRYKQKANR